jgi:uncharacterized protein YxjI
MAARFCMSCGAQNPAEARFCASCGTPASGAPAPSAPAPAMPPAPAAPPVAPMPPPSPAPPPPAAAPAAAPDPNAGANLSAALGLAGCQKFLVQHQLFTGGRSYRVLNHEKKHLFTVKENVRQELVSNLLRPGGQPAQGLSFQMGFAQGRPTEFAWTVDDVSKNVVGTIAIQIAGNTAMSSMSDAAGNPVLAVQVVKGMMGGLTATAAFPNGQTMFQAHGNLLRHNFLIKDPRGAEVAKIHEAWASIRDTYNLDLVGKVDPLCPLIFAILIDREKAANEGSA